MFRKRKNHRKWTLLAIGLASVAVLLCASTTGGAASAISAESREPDAGGALADPARVDPAARQNVQRALTGDQCRMPNGAQICGPQCGACPPTQACRGTDMTCGSGPAFSEVKCTLEFSLGTCTGPANNATRNHNYDWWRIFGPGGLRNGRLMFPAGAFQKRTLDEKLPGLTDGGQAVGYEGDETVLERRDTAAAGTSAASEPLSFTPIGERPHFLSERALALEPNAMLLLGRRCNATARNPGGGCQSSCCRNGVCSYCDLCVPNANTSSLGCQWCRRLKKPTSPTGCLLRGDNCTLPAGLAPGNPASGCKSGCCRNGKCVWCEECLRGCSGCAAAGQPLNPNGRCVTRTRTSTRPATRTRTTTKATAFNPGAGGPGTGALIFQCTRPNMFALTYDDGPFIYTEQLLNLLAQRRVKATFFVNGQNNGNIYTRAATIRRMRNEGHCIASHGWFHQNSPSLGYAGQVENFRRITDAIRDIAGVTPRFFRPPYGAYDDTTRQAARSLGQDLVIWNVDTNDWQRRGTDTDMQAIFQALGNANPATSAFISLMHDIYPDTASTLTARAIDYIQSRGYRLVDLGTCITGSLSGCYQ